MTVSVIVPFGGDCPHRHAALRWVLAHYEYETVVGRCDGPWSKALAVADALPRAAGDVLVVADADVWVEGLDDAIGAVLDGAAWAVPHRKVHRLFDWATAEMLEHGPPVHYLGRVEQKPYEGVAGGGVVVVPRSTYEQVPLDPRFVGWGGEDHSWGWALTTMVGAPTRGAGRLWHLWHPPPERLTRARGSAANDELRRRYDRCHANREAMGALLEEARDELASTPLQAVHDRHGH